MKKGWKIVVGINLLLILSWVALQISMSLLALDPPNVEEVGYSTRPVIYGKDTREINGNWYRQNSKGLWESYIEGEAYERGYVFGKLAETEIQSQEERFIGQIKKLVPSEWFLRTLKYGVVWFNRNLDEHVTEEYQREIYGVSKSFSGKYDFVGDKYNRILNYHAAHDIGHALQDLSVVGCTSFAVWNQFSADSSLLIGRNFDFYMGDEFAENKLILFVKPDRGHAFASVTWAGFMGVVSGMNEHGLTVTLNAAKSSVPDGAKTPISLLAREILQYAQNIDQAYAIAKSRETFVSESILVGSAEDKAAAIIEKSPHKIDIYRPTDSRLTCSNHYQSEGFRSDEVNIENIENSDSEYRFQRMTELIDENIPLDPKQSVEILRNQKGLRDEELGMGNPKAINQLLAHHGIVFQPEKRLLWVSANPFQLGEFLCYDLNEFFNNPISNNTVVDSLTISADPFLKSQDYHRFLRYKELKNRLFSNIALGKEIEWNESLEKEFIQSNPESYITYFMLGDYYWEEGNCEKAIHYYQLSLSKEVASKQEAEKIKHHLEECR